MNLRALASFGLLMACTIPAAAQSEERASDLREQSHAALAEGHLEEAFGLLRAAASQTAGADIWLEVAELADRLRLDAIALRAYRTYLARSPDAPPRRGEIEGRIRVLQHHLQGGGYAVSEDGRAEAVPARARSAGPSYQESMLVDWQGRPQARRPSPSQVALAAWNEDASPPSPLIAFDHVRGPQTGLGRALTAP